MTKSPAEAIRQRLLKGSAWVLLGKLGTTVLGLAVNGLLARLLPHKELGAYFLLFGMAFFGGTVSQLGTERAIVRLVSAALGTGHPGRARGSVRIAFLVGAFGSLVVASVFVLGLGDFLAIHVFHSQLVAGVVVLAGGWIITLAFQSLFAETFRGFQRFWLATLFDGLLVDIFSVVVFGLLFLLHARATLGEIVLLSTGATAATLFAGGWIMVQRVRTLEGPGHVAGREVFSIAWPMWVFNLTTFLVGTGVDVFLVASRRGETTVAYYGAASRLVFFVATPFIVVSQVVPPIIAELWAQGRKRELEGALREIATLAGLPAFLMLLAFLLFGGPIMAAIYGSAFFRQGASVLAILSVARMVAVITGSSGSALQMTGFQKTIMVLTICTGIFSLTLGLILVRHYGAVGVAWATATAQICQNLGQLFLARWRLGIWTHAELSLRPLKALLGRG